MIENLFLAQNWIELIYLGEILVKFRMENGYILADTSRPKH